MLNNKKAVDILICKNGLEPALYFIEIKYHKVKHSRLGTGHGKGGGIQPEILKLQPDYFKQNMLWILGSEDSEGYWLLKNNEILNYLTGGEISEKYNNIQTRVFKNEACIDKVQLVDLLNNWLN
jgi:hypothetical protein